MDKENNLCDVCGKSDASWHYSVNCCNPCRMVYRRSLKNAPKQCSRGIRCSNCRFCRLRQCIQAGMGAPTPWSYHAIEHLDILHIFREHTFLNYTFPENLNFEELIHSKSVNYISTSAHSQPTWTRTNLFTSIDFIRKFEVVRKLSKPEIEAFIKQSYLPVSMFFTAWNSFQNRKKYAEFPGEIDIISDELKEKHYQEENVHKIRCSIIEKLAGLEVKKEEFLLLNAIIVCDPAAPHLSEERKSEIENEQNRYLSLLLNHCLRNYQKHGPSRFANLLTILNTIKIVMDAAEKISKC
ncbi:Protein CBG16983 [Caenorhabditis briggsae]|uniref:Protein CBG16983 n=2 Tax=Caenorhabditis briggsae TaxID=6238 RepID=G2J6A4_CAEBR|nr:Protein CBG25021 [Caenorhabditis briggsae]XP_002648858.1 Protein CBG16983 [Caenorhabditis briggsae]ULT86957.1 hypothetical protein L3Y34_006598 [Caenorhabditis briggsae]CAP21492.1 Protein CBG25021 [Caenorhabditis briggsae]CAP34797.1 Protein CBG16983 [Caenorhabditis briggsae]